MRHLSVQVDLARCKVRIGTHLEIGNSDEVFHQHSQLKHICLDSTRRASIWEKKFIVY